MNDGVTVAKEVELEDPVENIGAKLVRQVFLVRSQHVPYGAVPYLALRCIVFYD